MRNITDHRLNGLNDAIEIRAVDEPGDGGANHRYVIDLVGHERKLEINFQNGAIQEAGYNGFTNEALLAVLIDRMRGFQNGQFKCRENAVMLTHLEEALMWAQKRTRDRIARGVEGAHLA